MKESYIEEETDLGENIEKMFTQDSKEKKNIAHGAKHMASRTGRIGSLKMPSDYAGKDYKKSSETVSYKVDEIIQMLSQTPYLKKLILEKLDHDYEHFRSAIEKTADEIVNINNQMLNIILEELNNVKEEVLYLKNSINYNSKYTKQTTKEAYNTLNDEMPPKKQYKKSSHAKSDEECKERVFERLQETESAGIRMTSNIVLKRHPVINYYLYKQKIWDGYKDMIDEYKERKINDPV